MKVKTVKIKNFRGYKDEVTIDFCDLTAFVGKNDVGKSTVLEALDIFFHDGKGTVKMDKGDINKQAVLEGDTEIRISICFDDIPDKIVIDATNETTLTNEYLLNTRGQLEITKKYPNAGSAKVFINAYHPTNPKCCDLLLKKNAELKALIEKENISCTDKTKNSIMRAAIWNYYDDDLQTAEVEIDITKEGIKPIYEKIMNFLPFFTLFQSDRKNNDGDNEVQDPLQKAAEQILNDFGLREKLKEIAFEVEVKLKEVSERTLEKLKEMNPSVANSLTPVIPPAESLKWVDVFKKVAITSDDDIPINKRGSGVKRLILLNFFRAEAERRRIERNSESIIYAIEEPETSQHTEHQKMMIKAFLSLSQIRNTQIIITTHSAALVKELGFENMRLISAEGSIKNITTVMPYQLPYPSLNEVNFLAFSETSDEYHNELYGFIEAEGLLNAFKNGKQTMNYTRIQKNGNTKVEQIILTEYIRHQIHHPENTLNTKYTVEQLEESICLMRSFISTNTF